MRWSCGLEGASPLESDVAMQDWRAGSQVPTWVWSQTRAFLCRKAVGRLHLADIDRAKGLVLQKTDY